MQNIYNLIEFSICKPFSSDIGFEVKKKHKIIEFLIES